MGAGLSAFPEALGIIFEANIGTTITGWMVALLGFKLKLGTVILPFILLGAMLKLFFSDKLAAIGYALAGFGLILVGDRMNRFELCRHKVCIYHIRDIRRCIAFCGSLSFSDYLS